MRFIDVLPMLLLGALGLVMFGLGLSLKPADFGRLRHHPKAVVIALVLQVLLLPALCWALVLTFGLPPLLAVGLMLLAASPGGVSANLFSHLFGGNVAMNISLTAITTVLSIVSMPLIANAAISAFGAGVGLVPMQTGKVAEVIGIVLLPVAVGMLIRAQAPSWAARMEKPFKLFSVLVLASFTVIAIVKEWQALATSAASIGGVVVLFNLASLLAGYYLSRVLGLERPIATAISFEIGIHNSTLAMYIALNVVKEFQAALPAAVYSVTMYVAAAAFGLLVLRPQMRKAAGD